MSKKINLRISPNSSGNKTNENINLNETYQLKDTTPQNRSVLTPLMSLNPCGLFLDRILIYNKDLKKHLFFLI